MPVTETTLTVPLAPTVFWPLAFLALFALASVVVFAALPDLNRRAPHTADWLAKTGIPPLPAIFVAVTFGILFLLALWSSFATLWTQITTPTPESGAPLGTSALIAALLGAPFLLWRSLVAQRTVNIAQESHITDLIAKAVEQLGAEKKVDSIGRPVTVWTGGRTEHVDTFLDTSPLDLPPRSREISRENTINETIDEDGKLRETDTTAITFASWSAEETRIEWRGEPPPITGEEIIASSGDWQVFSETVPNLEVRIGAILALERLARQNLDVHVQIMEILTAYIRENAKAEDAPKLPEPPEYTPEDHEGWSRAFADWQDSHRTALADIRPREDIQMALTAIGRRTPAQRLAEARWQNPDPAARFVFDDPPPPYPDMPGDSHDPLRHDAWAKSHKVWSDTLDSYSGYRIDLRRTNLRGADLAGLHLAGARLDRAQMQGATLFEAQMQRARLVGAQMQGASLDVAQVQGASLIGAQVQGASLIGAQMQGAKFKRSQMQRALLDAAQMQGAQLEGTQMHGALLRTARMQGIRLEGIKVDNSTSFKWASLRVAQLTEIDFRSLPTFLTTVSDALPTLFADASVLLPPDQPRPAHWPRWKLGSQPFTTEYAKWRASPATYTPPPPPTDTPPP